MAKYAPSSLKSLTLLGFALVSLPLILALAMALVRIDKLSNQGTLAIQQVSSLVYSTRQVGQLLSNMERSASQYLVLNDPAIWRGYLELRNELLLLTGDLDNEPELQAGVRELLRQEAELHAALSEQLVNFDIELLQQKYDSLNELGNDLYRLSRQAIDTKVSALEQSADQLRTTVLQSALVIPASLVIALLFVRLLMRPINQLKPQISRLQEGNFEQKVSVEGVQEIQEMAQILEAMRVQLLELEEQKSHFIRHISHELKTPLAAIREGAELLYDGTAGTLNPSQQEVSGIIRSSVSRLQQLIEDLLNFNMVLDNSSSLKPQSCYLSHSLERVLADRALEIQGKGLLLSLPREDYRIPMHPEHLRVILDNLLSNAVKFSPVEGKITVCSELRDQTLKLDIADEGPGIPHDQHDLVFEPFFQGAVKADAKIKGSGLGLTITRELVRKYNGQILLKDSRRGCHFEISLPLSGVEKIIHV
ncbi:HAMP domain-containing histidine kinase [Bowmanella sp. Y26]|uniref:HAMP domain-containing sensor histidine kinase n=1 Tax=Bowmanella yangjiangensis TaxID=2811230 RepID=UPI001BDD3EFD|nr:HAMP domain-containing sensor histidine kinase [Bowmanella yangjiangensis]MBT1066056.1 HAMP domain-containing histidine kinase [Bowmanella yangjiangensis]